MQLTRDQAKYVQGLWQDMREAMREFRKFDKKWNELNDALNVKLDREGTTDIVQRDKVKGVNIELKGYMAAAQWWRDKANTLASVIQAEQAAVTMLKGGGVWSPPPSPWLR